MFESFKSVKGDPIIELINLFNKDSNENKIDVGIGVFKNRDGQTPIMQAIKQAEIRLHDSEITKSYLGLSGNEKFNKAMKQLVFADSVDHMRIAAVQTPGGTGSLRINAETIARQFPEKTIWISDKTWANHISIFEDTGLLIKRYDYFDPRTRLVKEDILIDFVKTLGVNDILLLHGCCHNPTGADISFKAWEEIANLAVKNGFLPYIDLAYQGLGQGIDNDVLGVRHMASKVAEMIVSSSCSKNFGLYRERTGCSLWLTPDRNVAEIIKGNICYQGRIGYSMPPNYGAEMVADILNDEQLSKIWQDELSSMRNIIVYNRTKLADCLIDKTQDPVWNFLKKHNGMFSLFNLPQEQVNKLINEYSIYLVSGGRVNIAGLSCDEDIERFATCIAAVLN